MDIPFTFKTKHRGYRRKKMFPNFPMTLKIAQSQPHTHTLTNTYTQPHTHTHTHISKELASLSNTVPFQKREELAKRKRLKDCQCHFSHQHHLTDFASQSVKLRLTWTCWPGFRVHMHSSGRTSHISSPLTPSSHSPVGPR